MHPIVHIPFATYSIYSIKKYADTYQFFFIVCNRIFASQLQDKLYVTISHTGHRYSLLQCLRGTGDPFITPLMFYSFCAVLHPPILLPLAQFLARREVAARGTNKAELQDIRREVRSIVYSPGLLLRRIWLLVCNAETQGGGLRSERLLGASG